MSSKTKPQLVAEWRTKNPERYKASYFKSNQKAYKTRAAYIKQLKSVPCADCDKSYPPFVMDFDHINGVKIMNMAHIMRYGLARLRIEAAKCEVVCSNCHRQRTANRKATLL